MNKVCNSLRGIIERQQCWPITKIITIEEIWMEKLLVVDRLILHKRLYNVITHAYCSKDIKKFISMI